MREALQQRDEGEEAKDAAGFHFSDRMGPAVDRGELAHLDRSAR